MSATNRSSGRKKGNKEVSVVSAALKQQIIKSETSKVAEKDKKQVQLTDLTAASGNEIDPNKVQMVCHITHKSEEQAIAALMDYDGNQAEAIRALVDCEKTFDWVTKNKKKKKPPTVVNAEIVENYNDESENFVDTWDDNKSLPTAAPRGRGFPRNNARGSARGGRRGVSNRPDGRSRPWYGSNNKENDKGYGSNYDRNNRESGNDVDRADTREYRGGRGRRIMNGPSRGRTGRGSRGSGRPHQRTFQNNGNKDRGFFNQIDTWANPDTGTNKTDDFPSADDWDNEEYTGSLAVTQVFTPSAQAEVEPVPGSPNSQTSLVIESVTFTSDNVGIELKTVKENQSSVLPITMQSTQQPLVLNSSLAAVVATNNRLTPAQTQYLQQLTGQTSENQTGNQQQSQQLSSAIQQQPHQQPFVQQSAVVSEHRSSPSHAPQQQQSVSSQQQQQSQSSSQQIQTQQQRPLASSPVAQQPKTTGVQQQSSSSMIYNSSINIPSQTYSPTPQISQPFPVISQATLLPNVSLPQSTETFASITISSQTFSPSSNGNTFQPSPPMSAAPSYNVEFTSSNYSDFVNNYNATHGLSNSTNLSSRVKSQRPQTSISSKVSSDQPSDVEIAPSDSSSVNTTMKLLDVQFGTLEFTNSENYDNSTNVPDASISSLSNKYSSATIGQPSSVNVNSSHADLSVNAFQTSNPTQQKHNHPPSAASLQSVLVQNKQMNVNESVLTADVYSSQAIPNSRSPNIQELKSSTEIPTLSYGGLSADNSYQNAQQPPFQKSSSVSSSSYHQSSVPVSTYTTYGSSQATTSSYANQHSNSNLAQFSVYGGASTNPSTSQSTATHATPVQQNSGYTNSSYQTSHHPTVVSTLPSYYSYQQGSMIPPYQVSAGGLTQGPPYLGTQYGGPSLPNFGGVSYGATPFHTNYSVTTSTATIPQTSKITSSSITSSVSSKESQYDITPSASSAVTMSNVNSIPSVTSVTSSVSVLNLSQATAAGNATTNTASTKVTTTTAATTTTSGGKTSGGILPGIPAGVAPIVGPQYIMSQGTMPLYSPTFINYDDLHYMRGIHPHMTAGYLDMNYPGPQTNIPAPGREGLTVPFSSISDGRFPRPDNTTSPVPPGGGSSLSQQNTTPTHQQPVLNPLLQTYAAAYIYPYQQYTAPIYQVATTPTAAGHNTSNNGMTGPPFPKGPASYNSAGYSSQYDSVAGGAQNNLQDYTGGKVNSSGSGYSGSQSTGAGPKGSGNSGGGVTSQNANAANSADLPVNMYGNKSHGGLSKVFHAGANVPPPFTIAGGGGTGSSASGMNNPPPNANAGPYGNPLYLSGPPNVGPHHMHQAQHHQDNSDFRTSNMYPRSNYR